MEQSAGPLEIDAVITWVNGEDPAHREKLQAFLERSGGGRLAAADPTRFGDCGEIDYCVASLLRFAPWLRRIHIVSDAQTPSLIATLRGTPFEDRVRVVDHREIFAGYEQYLPTFSNRSIECLLWRIPGLAERFIYFNDDYQLIQPVEPDDFFHEQGVVLRGRWRAGSGHRLAARLKAVVQRLLGRGGGSESTARPGNHFAQEFSARLAGFHDRYLQVPHVPHPMRKSTLARHFESHPELLPANLRHRLRATEQFLSTSLSAHLELAAGSARIENRLQTLRLKADAHSPRSLQQQMRAADGSRRIAFACVQSLDLADEATRALVLSWLDRRVGRLDELLGQQGSAARV